MKRVEIEVPPKVIEVLHEMAHRAQRRVFVMCVKAFAFGILVGFLLGRL